MVVANDAWRASAAYLYVLLLEAPRLPGSTFGAIPITGANGTLRDRRCRRRTALGPGRAGKPLPRRAPGATALAATARRCGALDGGGASVGERGAL